MQDYSDYENDDWWLHSNVISMWDNMYRWREPAFLLHLDRRQNGLPLWVY